eukprot:Pgem_evm1s9714
MTTIGNENEHNNILIIVKTCMGNVFEFVIDANSRILDLKNKITEQNKLILEKQCLIYQGIVLDNKCSLRDYGMVAKVINKQRLSSSVGYDDGK